MGHALSLRKYMDWQVVIPFIGPPSNVAGCLASMGTLSVPVLLVDNSPGGDTKEIPVPNGVEVVYYPWNLGVAASWNLGIKRGADQTLVCSASMRFGEHGLARIIEQAAPGKYGTAWWGCAWHFIALGRALVDLIGLLDENFYPAYYEDNDYTYRARLAGVGFCNGGFPKRRCALEDLRCIGNAVAWRAGYLDEYDLGACEKYYERKWGGPPAQEKWTHPFNDITRNLAWWPDTGGI